MRLKELVFSIFLYFNINSIKGFKNPSFSAKYFKIKALQQNTKGLELSGSPY